MTKLKSQIESLLFISAKPMNLSQLSDLIKSEKAEIQKAGDELVEEYKENKKGIQIIKNGSKYQMVSSPENAGLIQEFIKDETTGELSRPSLEALTIIAYRGPVSKLDLDRIRGVNCALIIRNLLLRGLIEARFDKQKNETYYTVTLDFVRFLGINDVHELPDFIRLSQDDSISRFLGKELNIKTGEGEQAEADESEFENSQEQILEEVILDIADKIDVEEGSVKQELGISEEEDEEDEYGDEEEDNDEYKDDDDDDEEEEFDGKKE